MRGQEKLEQRVQLAAIGGNVSKKKKGRRRASTTLLSECGLAWYHSCCCASRAGGRSAIYTKNLNEDVWPLLQNVVIWTVDCTVHANQDVVSVLPDGKEMFAQ